MIGIYQIRNKTNEKRYIGQSRNILQRVSRHKNDLRQNIHSNKHLQAAWNKYGEEVFEASTIEECSLDQLDVREQYYLDTLTNLYNMHTVVGAVPDWRGFVGNEEFSAKVKEGQLRRKMKNQIPLEERKRISQEKGLATRRANGFRYTLTEEGRAAKAICQKHRRKEFLSREERLKKSRISLILMKDDKEITITNLALFCEEHGLDDRKLHRVRSGERKSYKGFSLPEGEREKLWQPKRKPPKEKVTSERGELYKKIYQGLKEAIADGVDYYPALINPSGEEIRINNNITKFCKENKLTHSLLKALIDGRREEYKGWKLSPKTIMGE